MSTPSARAGLATRRSATRARAAAMKRDIGAPYTTARSRLRRDAEHVPHHFLRDRERVMLLEKGIAAFANALAQIAVLHDALHALGEAFRVARDHRLPAVLERQSERSVGRRGDGHPRTEAFEELHANAASTEDRREHAERSRVERLEV